MIKRKFWKISAVLLSAVLLCTSISLPTFAAGEPDRITDSDSLIDDSVPGTEEDMPDDDSGLIADLDPSADDSLQETEEDISDDDSDTTTDTFEEDNEEATEEDDKDNSLPNTDEDMEDVDTLPSLDRDASATLKAEGFRREYIETEETDNSLTYHTFVTSRRADRINSYLFDNEDGTFTIVDTNGENINVETYDKEKLTRMNALTIDKELGTFGGFYRGKDYNYIVFRYAGYLPPSPYEVLRLVRYDKDFKRIDSLAITNATTSAPSYQVPLRMSESGDELVIHTARSFLPENLDRMISSQLTVVIDTKEMKVKNNIAALQDNYVNNPLNQYVLHDGKEHVLIDHCNAPDAIVLHKSNETGYTKEILLEIPDSGEENITGITIGGFEQTDTHYIVATNSIDHSKMSEPKDEGKEERDVVLYFCEKSLSGNAPKKIVLTDYIGNNKTAGTPYLVKLNEEEFAVLWEEYEYSLYEYGETPSYVNNNNGVRIVKIDKNGTPVADQQIFEKLCLSRDCQPVLMDGAIVWYTNESSTSRSLQMIETAPLKLSQTISISNLAKEYILGDSNVTLDIVADKRSGLTDFTFESSNPEVAIVGPDGTLKFVGLGKARITVYQAGNEKFFPTSCRQVVSVMPASPARLTVDQTAKKKIEGAESWPNLMYPTMPTLRWADPIKSYIYDNYDGTFTIVDVSTGKVVNVDTYDKSNLKRINSFTVPMELKIFGGFYCGELYNYIVFGQNNKEEDNSKEVYRLVKYDKHFNQISSLSLKGCFTIEPFHAGTLRMSEYDNELVFHTSRLRYMTEDGKNHQSQFTVVVDTDKMEIKNDLADYQENHVSHSFNQFALHDDGKYVLLDHGDFFPRSILINKYNGLGRTKPIRIDYKRFHLYKIPGTAGANCTGVTVGGFDYSRNNYIAAGNTIDPAKARGYDSYKIDIDLDERDVVIYTCPRNFTDTDTPQKVLLTDYVDNKKLASTPYLVKLSEDEFAVLWEEYEYVYYSDYDAYDPEERGVKMVKIDENGNKLSDILTYKDLILSRDCQPVLMDGVIVWYTNNEDKERHLQMIDTNNFKTAQDIKVTKLEKEYYIGDASVKLEVTPDANSGLTDFEFRSSNPEVARISSDGTLEFVGAGTADIIVYQAGNEEYAPFTDTQTITVKSIKVTQVILDKTDLVTKAGDIVPLTATLVPDNASFKEIKWTSSNPFIADVDSYGNVTCIRQGTATIKATAVYDGLWASCLVTVKDGTIHVTELTIDPGAVNIKPGDSKQLTVKVTPEDATNRNVKWSSSKPEVASVDENGLVTGNSAGIASVTAISEDGELRAVCHVTVYQEQSFYVEAVEDYFYTGKAIKPEVKVWDGNTLLTKGKDYKISYKNNVNVPLDMENAEKLPSITIIGIGNYTDKQTVTFNILPQNISTSGFTADDITTEYTGKEQLKKPVLKWGNKTLKEGKDYTLNYIKLPFEGENVPISFTSAGFHEIEVKGQGNYTGARIVTEIITEKGFSIAKANVAPIKGIFYTGEEIILDKEQLKVTMGSGKKKVELENGKDYRATYKDNLEVGKATLILTGIGNYSGTKKTTFTIQNIPYKKAEITGVEDCTYNGNEKEQEPKQLKVYLDGTEIKKDKDYTVELSSHEKAGTVKVTLRGKGAYKFTINKTYKILPYNLEEDPDKKIAGPPDGIKVTYLCGGSRPEPEITFNGKVLKNGTNYTISYQNNNAVTTEQTKTPVMKIKGKGNFKGTITKEFTIESKDLNDTKEPVSMTANNVPFEKKKGNYICKPILTDSNGKKLVAGKHYDKNIIYTLEDGTELNKTDQVDANTRIYYTVTGINTYTGTLKGSYYVTPESIAKAKVSKPEKTYTGDRITLEEEEIEVTLNGKPLQPGVDYRIVESSYVNNIKKGTAKVTIEGMGNYGGTKVVSFKINAKMIKWKF